MRYISVVIALLTAERYLLVVWHTLQTCHGREFWTFLAFEDGLRWRFRHYNPPPNPPYLRVESGVGNHLLQKRWKRFSKSNSSSGEVSLVVPWITCCEVRVVRRQFWAPGQPLNLHTVPDETLFCAFEAGDIVCWLVNSPIAKLDLFRTADCRWICKTYAENCCRNSATKSNFAIDNFCGCPSDLHGKGLRVCPWLD